TLQYRTDIPYAALMLSMATVGGGGMAGGISAGLSAGYPGTYIYLIPLVCLVVAYLALLIYYRLKRVPGRRYNNSTALLQGAHYVVAAIFVMQALLVDRSLVSVAATLCDLILMAFYINYLVLCLVLFVKPRISVFAALVCAVVVFAYGVTHLPS